MTPNPLFGDRMPVWAELDELLGKPEFDPNLTGVNATYQRLRAFGGVLGPAREVHRAPERLLAGMEWAGIVDPTLMHAAMVHYGVATTALVECGHPNEDLDRLTADLDAMTAPGVIVSTELGRGSSQSTTRTEARYGREAGTFTLHTPDDAALKIMPNAGWTGLARVAVVNARLVVDGADHGVHAFAVRLPHPRVDIATVPGGAPMPLDYSVIRFDHAELPYGCWLADNAEITSTGAYDPLTPQQRLGRSLGGVNAAVASAAVALAAAARATAAITTRFTTQRLVGDPGTPVLRLAPHRAELASAIAQVYAITCYADRVGHEFVDERLNHTSGAARGAGATRYAPWLAGDADRTLAKVAAATTLETVAATCRRLCGCHGVLHTNRISVYEDMAKSFHAAGGDSRLLLLEAGKRLLAGTDAPAVPGAVGIDTPDARSTLRLASLHERVLADQLRNHVDLDDPGRYLPSIEQLARVHLVRRTLQVFDEAVTGCDPWHGMLDAARHLYGIDTLLDSAAWHLNHGSLRPGDVDVLRAARVTAVENVIEHLGRLVDGLAVPPGRAGGYIGREDYIGRVASLLGR
ncbi:hypothetical protein [Haloechinothrix sp. LS1_15]|uniref:acyl-CoA dehydrogenase family protein n=1 Tax=Haloechinothrix sp. LS1_15 TaxID=2652248 RepID=UPI0029454E50|nr:hypothetical protein [Haloechinothrix sp. LS1_15]MDV6011954.1 hypothetical protein [Haloechinothrix sp. LS1_15]